MERRLPGKPGAAQAMVVVNLGIGIAPGPGWGNGETQAVGKGLHVASTRKEGLKLGKIARKRFGHGYPL
jgi:hypothetical protein